MHTRIACRISVIKWIVSRMWLPIESMARNWTTYISRQSSNNRVQQVLFENVQKAHPAVTNKNCVNFYFFLIFSTAIFPAFWAPNCIWAHMKYNSHGATLKIFKNWITQNVEKSFASLRRLLPDNLCNQLFWVFGFEWVSVSVTIRFWVWASGLLKSKVFYLCANRLLHIVFVVVVVFAVTCCFYLSCQLNLWNICWYFSFIFGTTQGDTTSSQAFLRSWQ